MYICYMYKAVFNVLNDVSGSDEESFFPAQTLLEICTERHGSFERLQVSPDPRSQLVKIGFEKPTFLQNIIQDAGDDQVMALLENRTITAWQFLEIVFGECRTQCPLQFQVQRSPDFLRLEDSIRYDSIRSVTLSRFSKFLHTPGGSNKIRDLSLLAAFFNNQGCITREAVRSVTAVTVKALGETGAPKHPNNPTSQAHNLTDWKWDQESGHEFSHLNFTAWIWQVKHIQCSSSKTAYLLHHHCSLLIKQCLQKRL